MLLPSRKNQRLYRRFISILVAKKGSYFGFRDFLLTRPYRYQLNSSAIYFFLSFSCSISGYLHLFYFLYLPTKNSSQFNVLFFFSLCSCSNKPLQSIVESHFKVSFSPKGHRGEVASHHNPSSIQSAKDPGSTPP